MFPIERLESPGLDSLLPVTPKDESYTEEMSRGEAALWSCGPAWDIVEQSHVQQGETRASLRIWMTLTSLTTDSVSAGWMSHSHKTEWWPSRETGNILVTFEGTRGGRQTLISLVYLMLSCRFLLLLISFRYELSLLFVMQLQSVVLMPGVFGCDCEVNKQRSDVGVLVIRRSDDWVDGSGYGILCGSVGSESTLLRGSRPAWILSLMFTFTFIFRAFSRRFCPKRQ